jgi:hypothetical protein
LEFDQDSLLVLKHVTAGAKASERSDERLAVRLPAECGRVPDARHTSRFLLFQIGAELIED